MNSHIPEITMIPEKQLVGKKILTSLAANKTYELWSSFMPRRKEIKNVLSADLYSVSVYDENYFSEFNPSKEFEKWAAAEVGEPVKAPAGFDILIIPGGLYAVFNYKGLNTDFTIFEYIFRTWLPQSGYKLDQRPHFELLGSKYKNNDPESEEQIFVPVKLL